MAKNSFDDKVKKGDWLLINVERRFLAWVVPKVPRFIETYHLTLLTVLWALAVVFFSYLSVQNIQWLWAVSAAILLQWVTDMLDGAVGRSRNTGLVKWGYFMDHFLDYVFLCAIFFGYFFIFPRAVHFWMLVLLLLSTAFMFASHISFIATGNLSMAFMKISASELRIITVLINVFIIFFGTRHLSFALPYIIVVLLLALVITIYSIQKNLWRIDMENKEKL